MEIIEGLKGSAVVAASFGKAERSFYALCRTFIAFRTGVSANMLRALFFLEMVQLVAITFCSLVSIPLVTVHRAGIPSALQL